MWSWILSFVIGFITTGIIIVVLTSVGVSIQNKRLRKATAKTEVAEAVHAAIKKSKEVSTLRKALLNSEKDLNDTREHILALHRESQSVPDYCETCDLPYPCPTALLAAPHN